MAAFAPVLRRRCLLVEGARVRGAFVALGVVTRQTRRIVADVSRLAAVSVPRVWRLWTERPVVTSSAIPVPPPARWHRRARTTRNPTANENRCQRPMESMNTTPRRHVGEMTRSRLTGRLAGFLARCRISGRKRTLYPVQGYLYRDVGQTPAIAVPWNAVTLVLSQSGPPLPCIRERRRPHRAPVINFRAERHRSPPLSRSCQSWPSIGRPCQPHSPKK